jgi:hypothetical protein
MAMCGNWVMSSARTGASATQDTIKFNLAYIYHHSAKLSRFTAMNEFF